MTPEQIQGWLQLGLGGFMLMALFLGYKRVWVFGSNYVENDAKWERFYGEVSRERDRWRDAAMRGIGVAEKSVEVIVTKNGNKP